MPPRKAEGWRSHDEAVRYLRCDPGSADLVRDSYLDEDVHWAGERFLNSAEFAQVLEWTGPLDGMTIVDLGSGNGIGAFAFATAGASRVVAVEPDPGPVTGRQAIATLVSALPSVDIVDGVGEELPVADHSVDIVYLRQVLHHVTDLSQTMAECYRVLRPQGLLLATREHVVSDESELLLFLQEHPIHQLAGGENAYTLDEYLLAIRSVGFGAVEALGPYESVINAYPLARSAAELDQLIKDRLETRLGVLGTLLASSPLAVSFARRRMGRRWPGRLYSFVAVKVAQ